MTSPADGGISSYLTATVDSVDVLLQTFENIYNEHNARYHGAIVAPPNLHSTLSHANTTIEKILVLIRRLLNKSCPIHRLPVELLTKIFSLVAHDRPLDKEEKLENWYPTYAVFSISLLPITLVCSHWYEVVTGVTYLWSTIEADNEKILRLTSRLRPSQTPLYATINHAPGRGSLDLLKSQGHRIREFRLLRADTRTLQDHTSFNAENLRFCHLEIVFGKGYKKNFSIFNGNTTSLEALLISGMVFVPENDFPALTHLTLDHYNGRRQRDLSPSWFRKFMEFLSRCPKLQVLHLGYLERCRTVSTYANPKAVVTLSHLRKLSIEGHSHEDEHCPEDGYDSTFLHALLKWLRFPLDTTFVHIYGVAAADFASVVRLLQKCGDPAVRASLSCLGIGEPFRPQGRREQSCCSLQLVDPRNSTHGIRIDVNIRDYIEGEENLSPWMNLCYTLAADYPYHGVKRLWLSPEAVACKGQYRGYLHRLFSNLSQVTTICLPLRDKEYSSLPDDDETQEEWGIDDEIDFVNTPAGIIYELGLMGREWLPCPKLHTLCLLDLFEFTQCQSVANVLIQRKGVGFPIRRLIVSILPEALTYAEIAGFERMMKRLVEDVTLVIESRGHTMPDDLLWERVVPAECWEQSRIHAFWPKWN